MSDPRVTASVAAAAAAADAGVNKPAAMTSGEYQSAYRMTCRLMSRSRR